MSGTLLQWLLLVRIFLLSPQDVECTAKSPEDVPPPPPPPYPSTTASEGVEGVTTKLQTRRPRRSRRGRSKVVVRTDVATGISSATVNETVQQTLEGKNAYNTPTYQGEQLIQHLVPNRTTVRDKNTKKNDTTFDKAKIDSKFKYENSVEITTDFSSFTKQNNVQSDLEKLKREHEIAKKREDIDGELVRLKSEHASKNPKLSKNKRTVDSYGIPIESISEIMSDVQPQILPVEFDVNSTAKAIFKARQAQTSISSQEGDTADETQLLKNVADILSTSEDRIELSQNISTAKTEGMISKNTNMDTYIQRTAQDESEDQLKVIPLSKVLNQNDDEGTNFEATDAGFKIENMILEPLENLVTTQSFNKTMAKTVNTAEIAETKKIIEFKKNMPTKQKSTVMHKNGRAPFNEITIDELLTIDKHVIEKQERIATIEMGGKELKQDGNVNINVDYDVVLDGEEKAVFKSAKYIKRNKQTHSEATIKSTNSDNIHRGATKSIDDDVLISLKKNQQSQYHKQQKQLQQKQTMQSEKQAEHTKLIEDNIVHASVSIVNRVPKRHAVYKFGEGDTKGTPSKISPRIHDNIQEKVQASIEDAKKVQSRSFALGWVEQSQSSGNSIFVNLRTGERTHDKEKTLDLSHLPLAEQHRLRKLAQASAIRKKAELKRRKNQRRKSIRRQRKQEL